MQRRFSSRGGVPVLEKWGGSLAVQPRWRRRTNVWREVTSPARGPKRPTSDRQRGAIFWAPPTGETPLRGQRCRSSPPFGGAKPREKPGMRTIVRSKSTQMRFVVAARAIIDTHAPPNIAETARWSAPIRRCGQPRRGKPRMDRASQMMVGEQASTRSFYLPFERTHH
jgi:hypothetical protein